MKAALRVVVRGLCIGAAALAASGGEAADSIFDRSLEELMNTPVESGNLTGIELWRTPVAVTRIAREQIALTPARNLADLIEIYVPGALWVDHLGPRIGMRGLVNDRNYKFLLRVNGKVLNQNGAQGATQELQNWDLNDIERVEIVRGPGSVTYGPGAIAGVIDIVTRTGATAPGMEAGAEANAAYDSAGGYASLGHRDRVLDAYAYASARWTDGDDGARFFDIDPTTGQARFIGAGQHVNPYLEDNLGDPQVKAHVDFGLWDTWRLWARFTSAGTPSTVPETPTSRMRTQAADGDAPTRFTTVEGSTVSLENTQRFGERFALDTALGYRRERYADYFIVAPGKDHDQDPYQGELPGNVVYDFEESQWQASLLGRLSLGECCRLAAGYTFALDRYRPAGGRDEMFMNLKNFTTADGRRLQDEMGDGFDIRTHSLLGEATLDLHPRFGLVLSGRADDNEQTDWMYSPRVAIVSELNERNVLKLIWQKSVRMSTAEEIYKEYLDGVKGDPETLTGYEIQHSVLLSQRASLQTALFYNRIDAIGWGGTETISLGVLDLAGLEVELAYRGARAAVGASHSIVKQVDWDSGSNVPRQGISTADYNVNGLTDTGNELLNWANHSTKLFAEVKLSKSLTLHGDVEAFWGFEGMADVRTMYAHKYEREGGDEAWDTLSSTLDREDFAGPELRLNLALAWAVPGPLDATLQFYGMNLLEARRYVYASGFSRDYPERISWVEEPMAFGVKGVVRF